MARDSENAINLDQMDDEDVRDLVLQELDEAADFDVDDVDITVAGGRVTIEGRVGTEDELQHVEQVLDRLGAVDYDNNVVVDENVRSQRAEAADTALSEDAAMDSPLGERAKSTTDEAQHLVEDTGSEQFGTHDMKKAIEQGQSYSPPDGPVQEGVRGEETH